MLAQLGALQQPAGAAAAAAARAAAARAAAGSAAAVGGLGGLAADIAESESRRMATLREMARDDERRLIKLGKDPAKVAAARRQHPAAGAKAAAAAAGRAAAGGPNAAALDHHTGWGRTMPRPDIIVCPSAKADTLAVASLSGQTTQTSFG